MARPPGDRVVIHPFAQEAGAPTPAIAGAPPNAMRTITGIATPRSGVHRGDTPPTLHRRRHPGQHRFHHLRALGLPAHPRRRRARQAPARVPRCPLHTQDRGARRRGRPSGGVRRRQVRLRPGHVVQRVLRLRVPRVRRRVLGVGAAPLAPVNRRPRQSPPSGTVGTASRSGRSSTTNTAEGDSGSTSANAASSTS